MLPLWKAIERSRLANLLRRTDRRTSGLRHSGRCFRGALDESNFHSGLGHCGAVLLQKSVFLFLVHGSDSTLVGGKAYLPHPRESNPKDSVTPMWKPFTQPSRWVRDSVARSLEGSCLKVSSFRVHLAQPDGSQKVLPAPEFGSRWPELDR